MTLPPLPEGDKARDFLGGYIVYDADQMRDYATAAVLAEREACAKVCDSVDLGQLREHPNWLVYTASLCCGLATVIRSRK